jgi:FkbM family methyltransferase
MDNNTISVNERKNYISIVCGNKEIRIRKSHAYYINDYTGHFNYYFNAVQPSLIEGKQVVDYTIAKKHKVIGYDLHEIIFPTMPEPICSSLQYVDFAKLTQDSIVLDLGAYSGLAAILFDQAIVASGAGSKGGGGKVISVEADIDNFAIAKLNFEEYKKITGRKIELIHAAVWSNNNGVEFSLDSGMGSAASLYVGERGKKAIIPSYTLSTLAKIYNLKCINFIKCDIEGAETIIFNDDEFFDKYTPRIIVELHEGIKLHGVKNITINTLIRQGYICTPVIQRGVESAGETLLECIPDSTGIVKHIYKNLTENLTLSEEINKIYCSPFLRGCIELRDIFHNRSYKALPRWFYKVIKYFIHKVS